MAGFSEFWDFLKDSNNRQALGSIGGGFVVFVAAFWTVFKYFHGRKKSNNRPHVEQQITSAGEMYIGGSLNAANSGGTIINVHGDNTVNQSPLPETEIIEKLEHSREWQQATDAGLGPMALMALIQRFAPNVSDYDQARLEFENLVRIALEVKDRGQRESNLDAFITAVNQRIGELTEDGKLDAAAEAAARGLADWDAQERERRQACQQGRESLLATALDTALL